MAGFIAPHEAARLIPEGATVMFGGFMGCGSAHAVISELVKLGTCGLTVICNDGSMPNGPDGNDFYGVAGLIHNKQVKKLIASHVGLNPEVAEQMNAGSLEVELIPQGSLAEMIRAGGAGLGGVLTPTGLGTVVQDAAHVHSIVEVDGKKYLLERPLRADFAVINGYMIDKAGNVWYKGTTRNFNAVMATAADHVIAEAEHICEIGGIEPENVVTPGILVDYVAFKEA
ncbi:MAG: 3-oxoacid CoA-transferase subunit A [Clostridiales bacterium]|jgi:acetate CoA/acetoacetate CoA-transferase alpha subunit|nr:3-oxoacid CoA-transferase subunit A [Clostridiales bacterium]